MFKMADFASVIIILVLALAQTLAIPLDDVETSNLFPLAICGGTIESDFDTVSYSGVSLTPGETCVWVIHLQTRMGFGFNFTEFDVRSQYTDCRDGGVRIYALTNLAPPNEAQSYTFCNGDPPPTEFFLGYSVAVVVLYVGSGNSNAGSGFELNWSGSSVDPFRTKHVSTYSTAAEAFIKYPVSGPYATSLAATWLAKPTAAQIPQRVDLQFENIRLEACSVSGNPCACDGIIMYQVGDAGTLNETRRMCGQESVASFYNLEPRFIIAFFTDLEDLSGGEGFTATYYPSSGISPSTEDWWITEETTRPTTQRTTTRPPTTDYSTTDYPWETTTDYPWETTTDWNPPEISYNCGEILTSERGSIEYKLYERYSPNERCIWTIRSTTHTSFRFSLVHSEVATGDHIYISTFNNKNHPLLSNVRINATTYSATLSGSVAVVTFASRASTGSGRGFVLEYVATGSPPSNITGASRDLVTEIGQWNGGSVRHPRTAVPYFNYELSSFVYAPPYFRYEAGYRTEYEFELISMESCCDMVAMYQFTFPSGWRYVQSFGSASRFFNHDDATLLMFHSDSSQTGNGFYTNWQNMYEVTTVDPITEYPTTEEPTTNYPSTEPTTTEEWEPTTWETSPAPSTSCGEIMTSEYGSILYKYGQTYDSNERCVWTIRSTIHTSFYFDVWSEMATGDHIYISTFTKKNDPLLSNVKINSTSYSATLPGSFAVITFATRSGSVNGRGFHLDYAANGPAPSNITSSSRDVLREMQEWTFGSVRHPQNGVPYNNNELSTFLLALPYFRYEPWYGVDYYLQVTGMEYPADSVALYTFTFPNGWAFEENLGGEQWRGFNFLDLTLFVFNSDAAVTRNGFEIEWYHGNLPTTEYPTSF